MIGLLAVACLTKRRFVVIALLFFALGIAVASHNARGRREASAVPADRFVTVRAAIGRGWEGSGYRFRLAADRFEVGGISVNAPLSIYLSAPPAEVGHAATIVAEGFVSKSERGRYSLSIKSARLIRHEGTLGLAHPVRWNRAISRRLRAIASDHARGVALVEALALGRSDQLPDDLRESYRRGGTYHLLVFSGMQIAIAAGLFVGCFRLLGRPRLGDFALLGLSALAPLFAGNEPSVSRASWMIGLYALSRILHRPTSIENLFFVSALARLIAHPDELLDPGFGLTYGATGGLILIGKALAARANAKRKIARDVLFGLGAELATTPLTLFYFHQYVIGSSIVTILLAPLLLAMLAFSFFVSIACFVATPAVLVALRAVIFLDGIAVALNNFFADSIRLCGLAVAPPGTVVAIAALVILAMHSTRMKSSLSLGLAIAALALPLALVIQRSAAGGRVVAPSIELLDVGQGDAVLMRDRGTAILVDGGGRTWQPMFGRTVLVPMLLDRGVRRLDAVALTHPDPDHCGGLSAVLENLDVAELWLSTRHFEHECTTRLLTVARARGVAIRLTNYAPRARIGAMEIDFIAPRLRFKRSSLNNSSIVFRVTVEGTRVLLAGDIEREAERLLVDEHRERLQADILKVPHHGSRSSSTSRFLDAVAPRVALISCGRRNAFGHPHDQVVEALRERAVRTWRTDLHGSIHLELGGAIRVATER